MPNGYTTKFAVSIAGTLLLVLGVLTGTTVRAAPVDPDASLPGIAPAGFEAFTFNDGSKGFGNNIESWFANYLVVHSSDDGHTLYARSEGEFKYWIANDWESPDSYLLGSGSQNLIADFDIDGNLLGGTLEIFGAIPGKAGFEEEQLLVSAVLVPDGSVAGKAGFAFEGSLLGFSIDTTYCAGDIVCTDSIESVYYDIEGEFPGFEALAEGKVYRTTMSAKTTVPLPASAWFMLSGLVLLGGRAKSRTA